jgi:hypothetical protein
LNQPLCYFCNKINLYVISFIVWDCYGCKGSTSTTTYNNLIVPPCLIFNLICHRAYNFDDDHAPSHYLLHIYPSFSILYKQTTISFGFKCFLTFPISLLSLELKGITKEEKKVLRDKLIKIIYSHYIIYG